MAKYTTKTFDRLDKIVERYYGDTDRRIVEWVIEKNPGIEDHPILLPAGLVVDLPDRVTSKGPDTIKQIFLWD